jgi:signal transduction histidine kinase
MSVQSISGNAIADRAGAIERSAPHLDDPLAVLGQAAAILAHEGRNLLQQTLFDLDTLASRLSDRPELLGLIGRARSAQRGLATLIEDLHQFTAPLRLQFESLHLADVWREAWADLHDLRREKTAKLRESVRGDVLSADRFRLKQVFRNLFENALATCPVPARIQVECAAVAAGDGRPELRVVVKDNGPGIEPGQQEKVFDFFFTTKSEGTGIGLAVVKRIVEAHGGRIKVDRTVAAGAGFVIELPLKGETRRA